MPRYSEQFKRDAVALYDNAIDTNYTHSIGIQKAKSSPSDTPSQTHILTLNPRNIDKTQIIPLSVTKRELCSSNWARTSCLNPI